MQHRTNKHTRFLFFAALACVSSVAGKQAEKLTTGEMLPRSAVLGIAVGVAGDLTYAVVQSSALPGFFSDLQNTLFNEGVVGWQHRFDCRHFASLYIELAQARYAAATFNNSSLPQNLAMAEIWYHPACGKEGHAIVLVVTEKGPVFIEPQTGRPKALNDSEVASTYFCRW